MNASTEIRGDAVAGLRELVAALREPECYPHAVDRVDIIETHISHVLLAGDYAYKIKKPVALGFLDFSTLQRRKHFCEEELRLNRRLAPDLYLAVVPIAGTTAQPRVGGAGTAIEYAVKMRRFAQDALLDRRLVAGRLAPALVDRLADAVAEFHARAARATPGGNFGTPDAVWAPMAQNFVQLRARLPATADVRRLDELEAWSRRRHAELAGRLADRLRDGMVRECHGDLHLGNIALVGDTLSIFDCIEFDPGLRWIDVASEIAFLTMDLEERGRPDYAHRLLDRYLAATGDYGGLPILPLYRVYRALVRAKVAAIRAAQEAPAEGAAERETCHRYLAYAAAVTRPRQARLILMHGLAGSGKTELARQLVERLGAVRLRSDIERKRLHGLGFSQRADVDGKADLDASLYGPAATATTYRRLGELARELLRAGCIVVVDAASLKAWQRDDFRRLAQEEAAPFALLCCTAPDATLRTRIAARRAAGDDASDADDAVLAHQMRIREPLSPAEAAGCIAVDTGVPVPDDLTDRLFAIPAPRTLPGQPGGVAVPDRLSSAVPPQDGDALLVVDVQNDFLPGGWLGVPGGDAVVAPLREWIARFAAAGRPVFATRDWHPPDHCSFAAQGGPWPPHCIAGTGGAAFAPGLGLPATAQVIDKATSSAADAYSGFAGTDLDARLHAAGISRLVVGGLATDYCVLNTVLDARRLGYDVLLLPAALRAVDVQPGDGARALAAMMAAGAVALAEGTQ